MTKLNRLLRWITLIDYRLLIIAILGGYYFIYWGSFQNFINDIDHCQLAFCDFVAFTTQREKRSRPFTTP